MRDVTLMNRLIKPKAHYRIKSKGKVRICITTDGVVQCFEAENVEVSMLNLSDDMIDIESRITE